MQWGCNKGHKVASLGTVAWVTLCKAVFPRGGINNDLVNDVQASSPMCTRASTHKAIWTKDVLRFAEMLMFKPPVLVKADVSTCPLAGWLDGFVDMSWMLRGLWWNETFRAERLLTCRRWRTETQFILLISLMPHKNGNRELQTPRAHGPAH